jgi:hypothetical protein
MRGGAASTSHDNAFTLFATNSACVMQGSWGRSPRAGGMGGFPPSRLFLQRSSAIAMRSVRPAILNTWKE